MARGGNIKKSALCVGGPLSGKRFATNDGSVGFTVPEQILTPEDRPDHEDHKPNKAAAVEMHHYTVQTFHTPQGDVEFFVPTSQTPLQTITMLLAGYEREANMRADLMAARKYVGNFAADKMNHPQAIDGAVRLYDKIGETLNQEGSG